MSSSPDVGHGARRADDATGSAAEGAGSAAENGGAARHLSELKCALLEWAAAGEPDADDILAMLRMAIGERARAEKIRTQTTATRRPMKKCISFGRGGDPLLISWTSSL
ncbi:hypothetical protein RI054_14g70690 [Pseudoscourfieldia marina]